MQVEICGRGTHVSNRLRDYIERRVDFALQRFARQVRNVRVQLRDLNGPRGGVDKSCKLTVSVIPAGTMFVEDRSSSAYAAIDSVVDKAATAIVRRLKRSSERGRTGRLSKYPPPKLGNSVTDSLPEGSAS